MLCRSKTIVAWLCSGSLMLANASPVVTARSTQNASELIPPTQDPFYTAPEGFENAQPGAILRVRPAPGNITTVVGNCSSAYNILYRTTDARYRPSWAVTTLYIPEASSGMELLSFQYPYNTPDLDHSPSYDFAFATPDDLPLALGRGWYVNVPDHEGPLAAIGANVGQGHATLDSIRAVLNADFGLDADAKYAMWGYSGGALASEWAAELQVQYAPELSIAGAALGGSPANITSVWDESNKSPYSGMMALSLVGPMRLYPEAQAYLYSQLKVEGEFNRTGFLHVEKLSAFEAFAYFAGQDMWEYFEGGRSILDQPVLRDVMDDNYYMGYHGVPQMPLFMYHAINDEVARIERAEELINRYCGVHVDIMFERNTVGTHIDEMANGRERALDWLSGVLAGSEQARGCTTKNVTVEATA